MRTKSIRRLDGQGRVILPSHIRKALGLAQNSAVTIDLTDRGEVLIKPTTERCCICGSDVHDKPFTQTLMVGSERKYVCGYCFASMKDLEERE